MTTRKILFYPKYFELARALTDEQFGRVLKAIGRFFFMEDAIVESDFTKEELILYSVMKAEIQVNLDKYEAVCKKRAEKRNQVESSVTDSYNTNNKNNNKNNNININKNKNNFISDNKTNTSYYDFEEIEHLELQRRLNK